MDRPYRIEIMPGVWLTAIQSRKFKSSYWSLRLLTPLTQETAAMNAVLLASSGAAPPAARIRNSWQQRWMRCTAAPSNRW